MHLYTEFQQNRTICGWVIEIWPFPMWMPSAFLYLTKSMCWLYHGFWHIYQIWCRYLDLQPKYAPETKFKMTAIDSRFYFWFRFAAEAASINACGSHTPTFSEITQSAALSYCDLLYWCRHAPNAKFHSCSRWRLICISASGCNTCHPPRNHHVPALLLLLLLLLLSLPNFSKCMAESVAGEGVCRPGQTSLLRSPPPQSDLQLLFLWLQR